MGVPVDLDGADSVGVESSDSAWFIVVYLAGGGQRRYGPFDLERSLRGMRRLNRVLGQRRRNDVEGADRGSSG